LVLVKQGTRLPFPDAGRHTIAGLAVPQSSDDDPVSLRVEVVAGEDERPVFAETWAISAPVSQGEPLLAEIRMDENQVLELRLRRAEVSRSRPFEGQIENPLTNVINPTEQELEAEKIEADFAARRIPAENQRAAALRLSQLLDELGQHEKAMEWLRTLQAQSGRADPGILHRMALLAQTIGDLDRAKKLYREAARADRHWTGPLFNLALMQRNQGELDQAQETIGEVLTRRASGPDLILAADIAKRQRREHEFKELLEHGLARMGSPEVLDDFELSWLSFAARLAQDAELQRTAEEERIRRGSARSDRADGELPIRTLRSAA
jgi:tetratricopeptide (TPR) repeat protein